MQIQFNGVTGKLDLVGTVGSGGGVTGLTVQDGISPVIPTGGNIEIDGAVVAAGTNATAFETNGTAISTATLQIQVAAANAVSDITKVGLASFDTGYFSVDASGFVSLDYIQKATVTTHNTAVATTLWTYTPPLATTTSVSVEVAAFGVTTPPGSFLGIGGSINAVFLTDGAATTTMIGSPNVYLPTIGSATATMTISVIGGNIVIQVIGDVLFTIDWLASITLTQS